MGRIMRTTSDYRRDSRNGTRPSYSASRQTANSDSGPTYGANQFSRDWAQDRYGRIYASRVRRSKITRRTFIGVGAAAVVAVGAAVIGVRSYLGSIGSRMNEDVSEETRTVLAEQQQAARERAVSSLSEGTTALPANWEDTTPFYTLLIGTDESESRDYGDESDMYGASPENYRSDTMILARIDPGNLIVTLVSIHRDTLVEINGVQQKMNAAYSLGGIAKVIEVVSNFAGVPISHYAQVDIDGLAAVTDAMGGVWVNVPYTIDDPMMGHLDGGEQKLTGEQALILCRSRHAFDYMGDGDRYRAAHQRLFLSAMASQLFASTPQTMLSVINTAANYITTDFTIDQIASLALTMKDMDVSTSLYSTMNPTTSSYIDGGWYEFSDDAYWAEIMAAVDAGEKPPVDYDYMDPLDDINSSDDGYNYTTITVADAQTTG